MDRLTVRGFESVRALEDFEMHGLNVLIGAEEARAERRHFHRWLSRLEALPGRPAGGRQP